MTNALAVCGSNLTGDAAYSVALRTPAGVSVARTPRGERGDLAPLVDQLCRAAGVAPGALGEVRADLGPGSYTGLRVALTFLRTLAAFDEVRVFGLDSLALLAAAAPRSTGRLVVVLDARRDRWHRGLFRRGADGVLQQLEASRAERWPELVDGLAADDLVVTVPGQQVAIADRLAASEVAASHRIECVGVVPGDAAALFDVTLPIAAIDADDLQPRYLMGSYAED